MGRPAEETETMTTSKAVLALCLVGAAVAAPQLRLGGLRSVSSVSSVTNQDEVVTNVVFCPHSIYCCCRGGGFGCTGCSRGCQGRSREACCCSSCCCCCRCCQG